MKLSPQKLIIVKALRSGNWVCGRTWLNQIKDDRKRIQELNEGYMKEKGYQIIGEPCKGKMCGFRDCPLYMRKAQKLNEVAEVSTSVPPSKPKPRIEIRNGIAVAVI